MWAELPEARSLDSVGLRRQEGGTTVNSASWDPAGFTRMILRALQPCLRKDLVAVKMSQKEKAIREVIP